MKNVLYMHTGSGNHGCEALVRTTAKMLDGPKDVILWSFTKNEDIHYGSVDVVESIMESEEIRRGSLQHFEALLRRKIFHEQDANMNVFIKHLFNNNVAVAIGGDNYCYEWSAKQGIELDKKIRKVCKKNVLWGCSIDKEALTKEVIEDLKGFDLITAREVFTYELLKSINPNTVKVADPAFLLDRIDSPLPNGFIENNTVGINISPLIMDYGDDSVIFENYENLIQYIIDYTDMNVCLIPHVVWEYNNDRTPIEYLYRKFFGTGRVCKLEDGNCCELKGYIARCRFFVGARTHATIAAYSTLVPTLVVGYSIKSRGIAHDLFGTDENYVLPVQNLNSENNLTKAFQWLIKNEDEIKECLRKVIPYYKEQARSAKDAFKRILE